MSEILLDVKGITANVEEKEILHNVNLKIGKGEVHVLMGPNGAGKSTMGNVLMGNPRYEVTSGDIIFKGQNITDLSADKRAKAGMFLSFQEPLEVPGLPLEGYLKNAYEQKTGERVKLWNFRFMLQKAMEVLQMDNKYAFRDLNVGFSGGEKKKAEILQLMMLKPDLAILDETDSGLDVDAIKIVSKGIEMFKNENNAVLIITHNTKILHSLKVDYVHVLVNGKIVKTGSQELAKEIEENGYAQYKQ